MRRLCGSVVPLFGLHCLHKYSRVRQSLQSQPETSETSCYLFPIVLALLLSNIQNGVRALDTDVERHGLDTSQNRAFMHWFSARLSLQDMLVWWKMTDHLAVLRCPARTTLLEPSPSICLSYLPLAHLSMLPKLPTPPSNISQCQLHRRLCTLVWCLPATSLRHISSYIPGATAVYKHLRPLLRQVCSYRFGHPRHARLTHRVCAARPAILVVRSCLNGVLKGLHQTRDLGHRRSIAECGNKSGGIFVKLANHGRYVDDAAFGSRFKEWEDRLCHLQGSVVVALECLLDH
jgi:hypothetical protein